MNLVFHTCTTKTNLNSEINLAAHTSCNLGSFSTAWLPPMSCSKLFFHPWLALHYSSTYNWLYIILPPMTGSTLFFHLQLALHYFSTHDWLYIILPPMTIDKLYIIPPPMTDRLYTIPYLHQLLYPPPQTCICWSSNFKSLENRGKLDPWPTKNIFINT